MLGNKWQIIGKDNYVDPSARNVFIVGDGNKVLGNISNVYIQGNNLTVDVSNTHIVDGVVSQIDTNGRSAEYIRYIDADYNMFILDKHLEVDTSAGDVTIDVKFGAGFLYQGKEFTVAKLVQANKIILDFAVDGTTCNGQGTIEIKNKNTSLHILYTGIDNNWRIT